MGICLDAFKALSSLVKGGTDIEFGELRISKLSDLTRSSKDAMVVSLSLMTVLEPLVGGGIQPR